MKKLIAALASMALAISMAQPAQAADAYNAEQQQIQDNKGIFLVAEEGNWMPMSTFVASESNTDMTDQWPCKGALDAACAPSKAQSVGANFLLPICQGPNDDFCIVSLELAAPGKEFETATYVRNATGQTFPAAPSVNYPGGSTASLWEAKGAPSASGTTTYAVMAMGVAGRNKGSKFEMSGFSASVVPYREQSGGWEDPYQQAGTGEDIRGNRARFVGVGGYDQACAWNEKGNCGIPQDYVEGTRVRLTVRISNSIGGWFKGRLKDPQISVKKFSASNNQITVEAQPATVGRMSYTVEDLKKMTSQEEAFFKKNGARGNKSAFMTWSPAWDARTFPYVEYFRSKVADTASGNTTYWNFSTSDSDRSPNRCLADKSKVLGIVTTNAMVYDGGVPTFSGGFLNYKVAGLHFAPGGEELNLGVYDMVMRSDTARCLYGFSKAPLSATVSVLNEKGTKTMATTVVKETKDGWLKLAAYGFTFSKKTIKVKITKKKK